ncbi:hypothetical protein CEXT_276521 [Caerostris extrusa]|uniref:Uncharacterized protein n=1 Tax=Caerostris extrusa TaxID=172846 RepID=A0AAV4SV59_CAEEX|nr:hypothetical protein CEXT_276521 [Caerostris extrusa]
MLIDGPQRHLFETQRQPRKDQVSIRVQSSLNEIRYKKLDDKSFAVIGSHFVAKVTLLITHDQDDDTSWSHLVNSTLNFQVRGIESRFDK